MADDAVTAGAEADAGVDADAPVEVPELPPSRYGVPVTESCGQVVLHPEAGQIAELVRQLRDEHGFVMCLDVCGVDYADYEAPRALPAGVEQGRYEVVYQLLSHQTGDRVRIRVQVHGDDPVVPSLFEVHPGTEAMEREAFDLYGIRFDGHPDLTRILMPEDWIGHPLRKDYAIGKIPVQFKAAENVR